MLINFINFSPFFIHYFCFLKFLTGGPMFTLLLVHTYYIVCTEESRTVDRLTEKVFDFFDSNVKKGKSNDYEKVVHLNLFSESACIDKNTSSRFGPSRTGEQNVQ